MPSAQNIVASVLISIVLIVAAQQIFLPVIDTSSFPKDGEECVGEPIIVDYEYGGEMMGPHECAVQCEDQKEHYILYTNNVGTQCQNLPGCSDWGEDNNVKCTLPEY